MSTSTPKPIGNDRFNAEAAAWDSNPNVHKASASAFQSILKHYPGLQQAQDKPSRSDLDVLEIGCGTGLLTFMLAPCVRSLTAVDAAAGMISALQTKLLHHPDVQNVLPVHALLTDPDDPRIRPDPVLRASAEPPRHWPVRRFHLIVSHLVLHHVSSLQQLVATMFGCLKAGGSVALTDFEDFGPGARRFHPEAKMEGVERHGVERAEMEMLLKEAGFVDVRIETAFELEKKVEKVPGKGLGDDNSEAMVFPYLICMGRKP